MYVCSKLCYIFGLLKTSPSENKVLGACAKVSENTRTHTHTHTHTHTIQFTTYCNSIGSPSSAVVNVSIMGDIYTNRQLATIIDFLRDPKLYSMIDEWFDQSLHVRYSTKHGPSTDRGTTTSHRRKLPLANVYGIFASLDFTSSSPFSPTSGLYYRHAPTFVTLCPSTLETSRTYALSRDASIHILPAASTSSSTLETLTLLR